MFYHGKWHPKSLELQVGSKQTHPDELTQVSDSGACAPLTPLRLQGRRVSATASRKALRVSAAT
ncbi:hypothetical protein CU280_10585 [Yersinia mollaretii]|nr:hypothetical protein CU280_10585 [Yersinia mollaretii]